MSEELKPCPFCGGKAEVIKHGIHRGRYYVRCCTTECHYTYDNEEILSAIRQWNTRPIENALLAILKELTEAAKDQYEIDFKISTREYREIVDSKLHKAIAKAEEVLR